MWIVCTLGTQKWIEWFKIQRNGSKLTIFWQILMIFLLLELNYTTWFDHPGLLNLGHFWPQFFVERRIFRSQRSRRIIPHRVSHTTTTQGYYYKGQLTGWQFTHVTYGTRQLASCYFWNSHTHTLSCRVHASQVCFFPHFFSRVVGLKKI